MTLEKELLRMEIKEVTRRIWVSATKTSISGGPRTSEICS